MSDRKYILSKESAEKKLRRMALEIAERNYGAPQLILLGIKGHGSVIAEKISVYLKEVYTGEVILSILTIDKKMPAAVNIEPPVEFNESVIILIDDVANSGRTMLYALKPLLDNYPKKIQTLALVERTHKSFPIALDYKGLSVSTELNEHITVEVEVGSVLGAWMK